VLDRLEWSKKPELHLRSRRHVEPTVPAARTGR
jgi:hypothetical protein